MKKILIMLCLITLLNVFSACGAQTKTSGHNKPSSLPETPVTEASESQSPAYEKLYIESGNVRIGLFDDANEILSALPAPTGTFEAESCAYQGMDCFYYYDGFQLMVNDIDGERRITSISIKDDLFKTPQGIKFGMSRADAKALMAPLDLELTEDADILQYIDHKTSLKFRFDLDKLVAAEYSPYSAE